MNIVAIALTAVAVGAACKSGERAPRIGATLPANDRRTTTPPPIPTLPPVDNNRIDMSVAGPAWAGFSIAAPPGTTITVAVDGPEVITVVTPTFALELAQFKGIRSTKAGVQRGIEEANGKVTFTVDSPDELAFVVETRGHDGKGEKGYGFSIDMQRGEQTYGCTALLDSEAQVAQAKAICNSLVND
jgi:hypothetical protein